MSCFVVVNVFSNILWYKTHYVIKSANVMFMFNLNNWDLMAVRLSCVWGRARALVTLYNLNTRPVRHNKLSPCLVRRVASERARNIEIYDYQAIFFLCLLVPGSYDTTGVNNKNAKLVSNQAKIFNSQRKYFNAHRSTGHVTRVESLLFFPQPRLVFILIFLKVIIVYWNNKKVAVSRFLTSLLPDLKAVSHPRGRICFHFDFSQSDCCLLKQQNSSHF